VLGTSVGVGALLLASAWITPASTAPASNFGCTIVIQANELQLAAVLGDSWSANETCGEPIQAIDVTSSMYGPSGAVEGTGAEATCDDCTSAESTGQVPIVVPGSDHTLAVSETAIAPAGMVWGGVDPGQYGSCGGSGSPVLQCNWVVPEPADVMTGAPSNGTADASQWLVDSSGVN
jgi:fructose-specific component phosphotransferase system IIB-like protein